MNCNEARQHVMLYLDSEGDPELHFRMSDHLAMCPSCAEWFARQQRLERGLTERLAAGSETPELWERVLGRSGLVPMAVSRRGWRVWGGLLGIAACLMLGVIWSMRGVLSGSELAAFAAAWHDRLAEGGARPDMVSDSDAEVERFLRGRVPFPVHCPPRKDVQFDLSGAGVCNVKQLPAAYIVGHVERVPVSILVLDRASIDAFPKDRRQLARGGGRHMRREGKYRMVSAISADNIVVVIGAAAPQTLERLVKAYGSYHGPDGA